MKNFGTRRFFPAAVTVVSGLLLSGCKPANEEVSNSPPSTSVEGIDPVIVATFADNGKITRADVDRAILSAPLSDRRPGDALFEDWYSAWIRELFLHEVLLAEAVDQGLNRGERFLAEARILRRSIYTDSAIQAELVKLPPFSEEEIEARIEEKKAELESPEIRQVYHIFRRFDDTPERSRENILEQLELVRRRVSSGENFGLIARQISDSTSRHQNGLLGSVSRGKISEAAEEIIFSLPEGEVSEPLIAQDGAHLFFNENTRAAHVPTLEEIRGPIISDLTYLRAVETLEKLAKAQSIQTARFSPDEAELKELFQEEDPSTVIFALGTFELTIGEFRRIFHNSMQKLSGKKLPVDNASLTILEEIKNREILFQSMLADTEKDYSQLESRFAAARDEMLVREQLRRRMITWLDNNPELLQEYFRNNRKRFDAPSKIQLKGLKIPIDTSAPSKMAILEEARAELESENTDWESIANTIDAEVTDWGWFSPNELATIDRKAARKAFGMNVGDISPPYTNNDRIIMFEVMDKDKGVPAAFDKIRTAVLDQYLAAKLPEVRKEVIKLIKEDYSFQEYPSHFPDPQSLLENENSSSQPSILTTDAASSQSDSE